MKFRDYVSIGLVTLMTGCSAPAVKVKDNFPVGTKVYSIPRALADSLVYPDSLTIKEVVKEKGIDALRLEKRYVILEEVANQMLLPAQLNSQGGYYSTIVESICNPAEQKDSTKTIDKIRLPQPKPSPGVIYARAKKHWYQDWKFTLLPATIGIIGGYGIAQLSRDNNNDNQPNPNENTGFFYGGRTDEGPAGTVRGGRDDSGNVGGARQ